MPVRSLWCAGFALLHSNVCFRNGFFSFTSPELFCTLLLSVPEGIFLEDSERFQCCHCTVALSSTTGTGVDSDSWNVIRSTRRASVCHPGMERMQQCTSCTCGTSTVTGPSNWALKCKTASDSAGKAGSCFSFMRLHKTREVKMLSGSSSWFSDRFITQWFRKF